MHTLLKMATRKKPQALPQVASSPGGKVIGLVTNASSIPVSNGDHHPAAIESIAPASSSMSEINNVIMTQQNGSFAASPMTSSRANGKMCAYVEMSPLHPRPIGKSDPSPTTSSPSTSASSAAAAAADAAESRVLVRESSLVANGALSPDDSSGGVGGGQAFEAAMLHGGAFSSAELGRLSLHCTPAAIANANGGPTMMSKTGAWSALDAVVLSTLANAAANDDKCGKRPVISLHQVSSIYATFELDIHQLVICL